MWLRRVAKQPFESIGAEADPPVARTPGLAGLGDEPTLLEPHDSSNPPESHHPPLSELLRLIRHPRRVGFWLFTDTPASWQTNSRGAYHRAAVTQAICRQYAAAQRALPHDTMYATRSCGFTMGRLMTDTRIESVRRGSRPNGRNARAKCAA